MNFLADESCAGPVIQGLREAGHDVVAIAEVAKGSVDLQAGCQVTCGAWI